MSNEWEMAEDDRPKEIVKFFAGEANTKEFIEQNDLAVTVELAKSLKKTIEDAEKQYKECADKIKAALDADRMEEKKLIRDFQGNKVILTKKNGRATIDWETWAIDLIGQKDVTSLLLAKEARSESKYIKYGADTVSLEIV